MSSTSREHATYPCEAPDCTDDLTPATSVRGSYCSRECYHRHRGLRFLANFIHDHRYCGACFRQLKEVSRPTDEDLRGVDPVSSEAVVGFQYLTQAAEIGERELRGLDEGGDRAPSDTLVATGTCCGECGTTDHRDEFLRDIQRPSGVARRILNAIELFGREGQHDKEIDARVFVATLKESDLDWALAVGRALE